LIWTKPSFSVKIEQSDVGRSTAWYKNSVTLSLLVFEFAGVGSQTLRVAQSKSRTYLHQ